MKHQTTNSILELKDVSFSYPDSSVGLDRCSLSIPCGSRTALLGVNGAGKTTLFLHLNGILRPQAGTVCYGGAHLDYSRHGLHSLRSRVGLVFQNPDSQLFSASVREDVSFGPLNLGLDAATVRERVEEALQAVGMIACADKPVHNLSYGQKKRVCIAGVLAMRPDVLVLDEPMAGLDMKMQEEILTVLERLHDQKITMIMATHDIDLAYAWADNFCILDQGRAVMTCSVGELPEKTGSLEMYGLGVPQVICLFELLRGRGLPASGLPKPRTCSELVKQLEDRQPIYHDRII